MGNDGGTLAKARQLLVKKRRPRPEAGAGAPAGEAWRTCAMTGLPLRPPLAMCRLGYLYNKDAVLEHLVAKTLPEEFGHVRRLADLCTLSPTFRESSRAGHGGEGDVGVVVCPVTGHEGGQARPFVAFWDCGHVVASEALAVAGAADHRTCPVCSKVSDPVPVNPPAAERVLRRTMLELGPSAGTKRDRDPTPAASASAGPDDKRARLPSPPASATAAPVSRWGAAVGGGGGAGAGASRPAPPPLPLPHAAPPSIGLAGSIAAMAKQATEEELRSSATFARLVHRA
jgi:hypothetical protein